MRTEQTELRLRTGRANPGGARHHCVRDRLASDCHGVLGRPSPAAVIRGVDEIEVVLARFDGSMARAVSMLRDRLNEARQIAGDVGGAALSEVQRQSRILDYFSCRSKIEQASEK
jgi:hypothetical protein